MSSLAQTSLEKSVRLPHVRDVIMYVCPLLVACSLVGLTREPQRLKPQVFCPLQRRALKARPFKSRFVEAQRQHTFGRQVLSYFWWRFITYFRPRLSTPSSSS